MQEKKSFKKEHPILVEIIIPSLVTIVVGVITFLFGQADTRKTVVREMSKAFDSVESDMALGEAFEILEKDYNTAQGNIDKKQEIIDDLNIEIHSNEETINGLNTEIANLKETIDGLNNSISFGTPAIMKNGEELLGVYDSVITYGGNTRYFSEQLLKKVFSDEEFVYNGESVQFNFTIDAIEEAYHENGKGVDMLSFDPVHRGQYIYKSALKDNSEVSHARAIYIVYGSFGNGETYIEYKIDKKYRYFECEFFIPFEATSVEETNDRWSHASIVVTDQEGNIICQKSGVNRRSECEATGLIDISNAEYIRVSFNNTAYGDTPLLAIGNPTLYQ